MKKKGLITVLTVALLFVFMVPTTTNAATNLDQFRIEKLKSALYSYYPEVTNTEFYFVKRDCDGWYLYYAYNFFDLDGNQLHSVAMHEEGLSVYFNLNGEINSVVAHYYEAWDTSSNSSLSYYKSFETSPCSSTRYSTEYGYYTNIPMFETKEQMESYLLTGNADGLVNRDDITIPVDKENKDNVGALQGIENNLKMLFLNNLSYTPKASASNVEDMRVSADVDNTTTSGLELNDKCYIRVAASGGLGDYKVTNVLNIKPQFRDLKESFGPLNIADYSITPSGTGWNVQFSVDDLYKLLTGSGHFTLNWEWSHELFYESGYNDIAWHPGGILDDNGKKFIINPTFYYTLIYFDENTNSYYQGLTTSVKLNNYKLLPEQTNLKGNLTPTINRENGSADIDDANGSSSFVGNGDVGNGIGSSGFGSTPDQAGSNADINKSDPSYNLTSDNYTDYLKNGFGLLGNSGLIAMLGNIFTFIPEPIITLMISFFSTICLIAVIKFIRG